MMRDAGKLECGQECILHTNAWSLENIMSMHKKINEFVNIFVAVAVDDENFDNFFVQLYWFSSP